MGSIPPELSLDVRQILISKTIGKFLADVSTAGGLPERIMKLDDLLARLDEELRKIEAFKRELPLCVCLLNDAIGAVNEELMECKKSIVEPKLSEFIPLKNSREEDDKEEIIMKENEITDNKKNWLSSAQLWNNYDSPIKDEKKSEQGDRPVNVDVGGGDDRYRSCKNMDGAGSFLSFKDFSVFPARTKRREEKQEFPVSGLPFVAPAIKNLKEDLGSGSTPNIHSNLQTMPLTQQQQQQSGRKQRRCWSPELHRRFVNALQQLGGSQAATPKQIRELMQVDGLTNDEVKSHLQKYRLHTRRLPTTNSSSKNQILGALWMGKEGYSVSESSKQSDSGSPQGPLQLNGNSSRGDSICGDDDDDDEEKEEEEEEDDELDRHSWRNRTRKPVKHV